MLVVASQGIPLGVLVESAQRSEVKLTEAVLAKVKVPKLIGRSKTKPKEIVADKGYDSDVFRRKLRARGIRPCIPRRRNAKLKPGKKPDLAV